MTHIQNFGCIGFQPIRENQRIAYLKLGPGFLQEFGLAYRPEMEEYEQSVNLVLTKPIIKPQFPKMAQMAQLDKTIFHNAIMSILSVIGELLYENENVEIDLAEYGKIQGVNRQLLYAPINRTKAGGQQGKQTVKNLMNFGGSQRAGQLQPLPQELRQSQE